MSLRSQIRQILIWLFVEQSSFLEKNNIFYIKMKFYITSLLFSSFIENYIIVHLYNINKQTSCFFSAPSNHKKMNIIIMKSLFPVSASIHLWTQMFHERTRKKRPAFQMMRIEKKNHIILCKLNIILKWTEMWN